LVSACPRSLVGSVINLDKTLNGNDSDIDSLIAQAESIKDNADAVLAKFAAKSRKADLQLA
jgi:hypothetical protein